MEIAFRSLRLLAFRVSTVAALLAATALTARWLGPEGRGIYVLVLLYSSLGVTLLGGVGSALAYEVSNQGQPVREVAARAAALALAIGVAALLACVVYVLVAGGSDGWWLLVAGAAQPPLLLATALTWAFLGADDQRGYNRAIIAPSWLGLLTLVALLGGQRLVTGGNTVQMALLAWLLAQIAVVLWLLWLGRQLWLPPAWGAISSVSLGGMIAFGAQTGLADLVSFFNYRVDALALNALRGPEEVGIYSVAVQVAEGLWFISSAVGVVIYARVGSLPRAEAAALTAQAMRHAVFVIAVLALGLMAVSGVLFPLLFGSDYRDAVGAFRLLAPGIVIFGLGRIFSTYFTNALGKPRVPLLIAATSLAIGLPLCLLLIPRWGMNGAAVATTLSYTASMLLAMLVFRRSTGIPLRRMLLLSGDDLRAYPRFGARLLHGGRRFARGARGEI